MRRVELRASTLMTSCLPFEWRFFTASCQLPVSRIKYVQHLLSAGAMKCVGSCAPRAYLIVRRDATTDRPIALAIRDRICWYDPSRLGVPSHAGSVRRPSTILVLVLPRAARAHSLSHLRQAQLESTSRFSMPVAFLALSSHLNVGIHCDLHGRWTLRPHGAHVELFLDLGHHQIQDSAAPIFVRLSLSTSLLILPPTQSISVVIVGRSARFVYHERNCLDVLLSLFN